VKEKRRKRGRKCRNWIARRESLGASNCLFRELFSDDPKEFFRYHQRQNNGKESRKHLKLSGISPNCCEAIDGKHCQIRVKCPDNSCSVQNFIITKGPTV
jgi:hypothetical protein